MNLHDRADRFERLTYLLVLEAELRSIAAERDRRARARTITVAANGTARLPHDWQACVEPVGGTAAFKRRMRAAADYPRNPDLPWGCNGCNSDGFTTQLAGE